MYVTWRSAHYTEEGTQSRRAEPWSPYCTWAQSLTGLQLSNMATGAGTEQEAGNNCHSDYKIDIHLSMSFQSQSFSIKAANFKERCLLL